MSHAVLSSAPLHDTLVAVVCHHGRKEPGMSSSLRTIVAGLVILTAAADLGAQAASQVDNLRAFARLYGYVRFFHPSDEAALVDWDRFAVYGAARVRDAADAGELHRRLEELFAPIAPTLVLHRIGEEPPPPAPPDMEGVLLAWQHRGVGLTGRGIYESRRTHRPTRGASVEAGSVIQSVPAEAYRGAEIRIRAAATAETEGVRSWVWLWVRMDLPDMERIFEGAEVHLISGSEWTEVEVVDRVPDDAKIVVFGASLNGEGRARFDGFEVSVRREEEPWRPVEIENPGFEASAEEVSGWYASQPGFAFELASSGSPEGRRHLRVRSDPATLKLFDAMPDTGEMLHRELGAGLACRLPMALRGPVEAMASAATSSPLAGLIDELEGVDVTSMDDVSVRLAGVIIAWNVLRHFYPYFDVVDVDWDGELTTALEATLAASSRWDFYLAFQRLIAALDDGHGAVRHSSLGAERGFLPWRVVDVDGRIVIDESGLAVLQRGDVVVSIDGEAAEDVLRHGEEIISGSPQWKRHRALMAFGWGTEKRPATLAVRRGGKDRTVVVERSDRREWARPHEKLEALQEGIVYVDLVQASMDEIRAEIDTLAAAPGVVFDLRGYPQGNHEVIRHLIDEPVRSAHWMVPLSIYPDGERFVDYDRSGRWLLEPEAPRFEGKAVFLTDGSAISYSESFLGIVEHYRLAEIVGEPTAGANGNVNAFETPGGFRVSFTGMKVLKHDQSQHHLVGIRPTAPCRRGLAGLVAGRDECLEKAVELIRQ